MEVMSRGKWVQGLTWMPRLRRSSRISSLSTMRKSRPNLSRIWSRHWTCSDEGQTTSTRRARCRMMSSETARPGLDGLAEAHVVGDEQVDPWHLDGPHHRVKLVVLDVDARAERGLDVLQVGGGGGPPAHGIEEGVEPVGGVEAGRLGQGDLLDGLGAGLDLPDDLQLFAEAVVLDRGEGDEVLRLTVERSQRAIGQGALDHLAHDPLALPDIDQLPLLRGVGDSGGHETLTASGLLPQTAMPDKRRLCG